MNEDPRVAEIAARAEAATKGPWIVEQGWIRRAPYRYPGHGPWEGPNAGGVVGRYGEAPFIAEMTEGEDTEFIAHARDDIPFLLSEVRRLRSVVEDAERVIAEARKVANRGTWVTETIAELRSVLGDQAGADHDQ